MVNDDADATNPNLFVTRLRRPLAAARSEARAPRGMQCFGVHVKLA